MNFKRILVPVDFSPPSTLAVNCGIALARKFRANLSLLHVVESPSALIYTFPIEADKVQKQRKEQAERMLPALVASEDEDDLDVHFIVRAGEIDEMVESVLHEEQADVVVMGTHGRGLFGRILLGSVTQALLRKLRVPVLTVCHVSRPFDFKRILFATDFGPDSEKGFRFALDMASAAGSSLLVVHTIDKPQVTTYETSEVIEILAEARREAVKHIHEQFAELRTEGARRKVFIECVLQEGDATEEIPRIADQNEADLMILGLRKKGIMERALLGSTAEPVIRAAHVPVLSVPIDS